MLKSAVRLCSDDSRLKIGICQWELEGRKWLFVQDLELGRMVILPPDGAKKLTESLCHDLGDQELNQSNQDQSRKAFSIASELAGTVPDSLSFGPDAIYWSAIGLFAAITGGQIDEGKAARPAGSKCYLGVSEVKTAKDAPPAARSWCIYRPVTAELVVLNDPDFQQFKAAFPNLEQHHETQCNEAFEWLLARHRPAAAADKASTSIQPPYYDGLMLNSRAGALLRSLIGMDWGSPWLVPPKAKAPAP